MLGDTRGLAAGGHSHLPALSRGPGAGSCGPDTGSRELSPRGAGAHGAPRVSESEAREPALTCACSPEPGRSVASTEGGVVTPPLRLRGPRGPSSPWPEEGLLDFHPRRHGHAHGVPSAAAGRGHRSGRERDAGPEHAQAPAAGGRPPRRQRQPRRPDPRRPPAPGLRQCPQRAAAQPGLPPGRVGPAPGLHQAQPAAGRGARGGGCRAPRGAAAGLGLASEREPLRAEPGALSVVTQVLYPLGGWDPARLFGGLFALWPRCGLVWTREVAS